MATSLAATSLEEDLIGSYPGMAIVFVIVAAVEVLIGNYPWMVIAFVMGVVGGASWCPSWE